MLNHLIYNTIYKPKELVLLTLGLCLSSPASALDFNLNPASVSPGTPVFTANALTAGEVSNISFIDNLGDFQENGFGLITGAQLNSTTLTSTGLAYTLNGANSTTSQTGSYSLYFQFSDTGNAATGQLQTGSFSFYAVSGQSIFSITNANVAQETNTGTPILLATANLSSGTLGQSQAGLSANAVFAFTPTTNGTAVLGLSDPTYTLTANFSHSFADGGVVPNATGFNIYGGNDTLSFSSATATPELQEWLMLIIGLPCISWIAKRKQAADLTASFLGGKHAILG